MDKVVILARVSTQAQDYQRQVTELQEYCDRAGWEVTKVFANKVSGAKAVTELQDYCDRAGWEVTRVFANKVSGAKAVTERAEIVEMVEYIKRNDIQRVVCLEISRLGRNTLEALKVINYLNENGVSLYVKNYNLETLVDGKVNPVASLICTILLEIASMERLTIKERMTSGRNQYIAKCKEQGIKMGRPSSYRKSDASYKEQYGKEISLLKKGISLRNVSQLTGTSVNTLRKLRQYA